MAAEAVAPAGRAERSLFDGACAFASCVVGAEGRLAGCIAKGLGAFVSRRGSGAEGGVPVGAGRRIAEDAFACGSRGGSGAEVLLQADAARSFAVEAAAPPWIADRFRARSASPAGRTSCSGAEVRSVLSD